MGRIDIQFFGSFPGSIKQNGRVYSFSAEDGGHADAIGQAIKMLASEALPKAIILDHQLAKDGHAPARPFGTGKLEEKP